MTNDDALAPAEFNCIDCGTHVFSFSFAAVSCFFPRCSVCYVISEAPAEDRAALRTALHKTAPKKEGATG
jgi:hypothetical protein